MVERFLKYFVPERYALELDIDKQAKTIGGLVKVSGEVISDTIKFHAVKLKVLKVIVDDTEMKFENDGEVLSISGLKPGKAEIKIEYTGYLNENMQGAYLSYYEYKGAKETIVATQFESHHAREAFPCIDEPAAKAEFDVKITTPYEDDLVLVNTPSPRMSTYLLAWVIGKFHGKTIKNEHGVEITTYCALNQDVDSVDFANEVAAKSLEFYDDNFGVKYPLNKCIQVALPDFEAGAMENWGLVTYRESMLLASKDATLATRKSVALTVAHELSHQWFGDLVTMEWWDDLWLNESFASVMEYYAVDFIHPEYKIWESFFTGDALSALRRDCISGVQSVHQDVEDPAEIESLFDPAIVYAKGARLMLMVIRMMEWHDFCKGIFDYFEKYKYQNTVGDNLWDALNKYADFDVKEMMHAFIDRPGYPVISGGSQKRFLLDGEMEDSNWPLTKVTEDMSGHYILNLTDKEFNKKLAEFDTLSLEEKLRLLIDRDLLAKTDLASSASLIPLISKFKEEESAAVWNIILTIVSGLKCFFEHKTPQQEKFKKFVGELAAPGISKVGLSTRDDDDENTLRLRSILLALDFYAGTKGNLKKLAAMYNSNLSSLDPETRSDILDAKLFLEPEYLDEYLEKYKTVADPEIKFDLLVAMTLMEDKKALSRVMRLLEQPEVVKPQDQFYLFIYLYRNPVVKKEVFEWLTSHWEFVKKMSGDKSLDNYPRYTAGAIKTDAEFKEYKKFFEPMISNPALSRVIEMGKNEIAAKLKLIKSDKEAVYKALSS